MNSASISEIRGSVLVLSLVLIPLLSMLSLAGFYRTSNQSQLAAAIEQHFLLREATHRTLAKAARLISVNDTDISATAVSGCPRQCDWERARLAQASEGVRAVYIVQRVAPESGRFLINARATSPLGGESIAHGLFDAEANRFLFVR